MGWEPQARIYELDLAVIKFFDLKLLNFALKKNGGRLASPAT
jgi:hypothetical protein